MMSKGKKILLYSTLAIIGTYFLIAGLYKAKEVLAPLATAGILILLVLPLANKMEAKMKRSYSSLLNTLLLFLLSLLFVGVLVLQVKTFVDDWPQIQETMEPKLEQLKSFLANKTPLSESDLKGPFEESTSSSDSANGAEGNEGEQAISALGAVMGYLGTYLLTFVYVFFLLNYRRRFKEFLLRLFPDDQQDKVKKAIHESAKVVQQYLLGKLILIGFLAILYSIGLGLSGVNNFILISILAAVFTLIPYIGNIIGFALAISFGFVTSGEIGVLIGIILTFSITQFIESYVFEPYIVGEKVDVHPFFVILGIVIGNAIWGVIGMILAIPILAIITIVLLRVPPLHPFGFLFSDEPVSE